MITPGDQYDVLAIMCKPAADGTSDCSGADNHVAGHMATVASWDDDSVGQLQDHSGGVLQMDPETSADESAEPASC